ncbi:hypothetical protein HNQ93_003513 [Hymenobacter luteus]|uniref:DUF3805 domain-containing protein n=2 Tax=Hymenobacter TaxID=89966 RepID=A0A7W9WC97_9BACT|nr:hypothetical protein [Hymenobacter latericoloratus]MBB4602748.1 hypothetical protein [Hymenobacter latericoloratus]MBB6060639.1 hypothetical protein [Hymenobacter luteus]
MAGIISLLFLHQTFQEAQTPISKPQEQTIINTKYGRISIRGKWKNTAYNPDSRQYEFTNEQNELLAITKAPKKDYPFYSSSFTDNHFAHAYYKWESEFWKNQGLSSQMILNDNKRNYVICKFSGKFEQKQVNNTFLFASKKGFAYNILITSDKLSQEKKIELLTSTYEAN